MNLSTYYGVKNNNEYIPYGCKGYPQDKFDTKSGNPEKIISWIETKYIQLLPMIYSLVKSQKLTASSQFWRLYVFVDLDTAIVTFVKTKTRKSNVLKARSLLPLLEYKINFLLYKKIQFTFYFFNVTQGNKCYGQQAPFCFCHRPNSSSR